MSLFKKIVKLLGMETYTIPVDSFRKQFGHMMTMDWVKVKVIMPSPGIPKNMGTERLTFPINEIHCLDDEGNPKVLIKKPSHEIRFTDWNGKKTVFYFDTIQVENDIVSGDRSMWLGMEKKIPLKDVMKIEIHDGKKNMKYA